MSYTAYHAPSGEFQSGFETEALAFKHVEDEGRKCFCCKGSQDPCEARMAEWFVMPTVEFEESDDFGDILKASGCIEVKKK